MRVFTVSSSGARIAVPGWFPQESRYAFFHGGEGVQSWQYCLRLSKRDFPRRSAYDWGKAELRLFPSVPPQWDEFGNRLHILKRGVFPLAGECIVFLDMSPGEKGMGVLHSWNPAVRILGHGMEMKPAPRDGHKGARRALEIDYPVLVCARGAEFSWEWSGQMSGGGSDYTARWDGAIWRVQEYLGLPRYAESHLETRGFLRL